MNNEKLENLKKEAEKQREAAELLNNTIGTAEDTINLALEGLEDTQEVREVRSKIITIINKAKQGGDIQGLIAELNNITNGSKDIK